jgi:hypothetical protein
VSKKRIALTIVVLILLSTVVWIVIRVRRQQQSKGVCSPCASTVVLSYDDFGPQVMSYELIGMGWNQWKSEGHPLPDDTEISVAVYRGIDLKEVKARFPTVKGKSDYRYVEYSKALAYLREKIETVDTNTQQEVRQPQPEPNAIQIWDQLLLRLKKTQGQIIENLGA